MKKTFEKANEFYKLLRKFFYAGWNFTIHDWVELKILKKIFKKINLKSFKILEKISKPSAELFEALKSSTQISPFFK